MIKETCSCGATFEINVSYANQEQTAVAAWRQDHRHSWGDMVQKVMDESRRDWRTEPIQPYGSGSVKAGIGKYTLNEDFVIAHNGEPCWIGQRSVPDDWNDWAIAYQKNYLSVADDISIPDPPEPFAKPGTVV